MLQYFIYAILVLVLVFIVGGFVLPNTKDQTVKRALPHDAHKVYTALLAAEQQPLWRSDLAKVEPVSRPNAVKSWIEYPKQGSYSITFSVVENIPDKFIRMEFSGSTGFSGSWTGALTQENGRTVLTSTEHVEVSSFVGRWFLLFMPLEQSMNTYLSDLEAHLSAGK